MSTLLNLLTGAVDFGPKVLWVYDNRSEKSSRLLELYAGRPRKGFPIARYAVRPGEQTQFLASGWRRRGVSVVEYALIGEPGEKPRKVFLRQGPVHRLCTRWVEAAAEVYGIDPEPFVKRARDIEDAARRREPLDDEGEAALFIGTERDPERDPEREPPETHALARSAAFFRMRDTGGLHVRPAVLIQKALKGMEFAYVEAIHTENGRRARTYGPQAKLGPRVEKGPAFWMLLLRLEARRNEVVEFVAVADSGARADAALEAVGGVLGRTVPQRYDYWRELGPEGFAETYFEDAGSPQGLELDRRYQLFDKAAQEPKHVRPNRGAMAERVVRRLKAVEEEEEGGAGR